VKSKPEYVVATFHDDYLKSEKYASMEAAEAREKLKRDVRGAVNLFT
jgi:hypothetical protein